MIIVTVGLQSPGEFWSNEEDDMEKETYLGCKKNLKFLLCQITYILNLNLLFWNWQN